MFCVYVVGGGWHGGALVNKKIEFDAELLSGWLAEG